MTDQVAVDRFERLYHDPSQLYSTVDMSAMKEQEAFDQGVIPCSQCFPRYYRNGELTLNVTGANAQA